MDCLLKSRPHNSSPFQDGIQWLSEEREKGKVSPKKASSTSSEPAGLPLLKLHK